MHYFNSGGWWRGWVSFFRHTQPGHVGPAEWCREVSSFSTVLGPPIMISLRQAAPSRYQHIISGLVQPLNHTRHRNPLVSVTFSPTQEARSQSAIWILWSLSFYFPRYYFFISIPQDLSKHHLTIAFSAFVAYSVIPFVSGQQSPSISSLESISFIPQNIFSPHARINMMYGIQDSLTVGKLTVFPMSWLTCLQLGCMSIPRNWYNLIIKFCTLLLTFNFTFALLHALHWIHKL